MSRYVPQPASMDPIELAVWSAEFVRARHGERGEHQIDEAIRSANTAVDDLRRTYKR